MVGLGVWSLAASKQREIDRAPTATVGDLEYLQDLEASARWRYRASNALIVGGVATLAAGAVLASLDLRAARRRGLALSPPPAGAGVVVTLTLGGR